MSSDERLEAAIARARVDAGAARMRAVGSRRPDVHEAVAARYDELAGLLTELAEHRSREGASTVERDAAREALARAHERKR